MRTRIMSGSILLRISDTSRYVAVPLVVELVAALKGVDLLVAFKAAPYPETYASMDKSIALDGR